MPETIQNVIIWMGNVFSVNFLLQNHFWQWGPSETGIKTMLVSTSFTTVASTLCPRTCAKYENLNNNHPFLFQETCLWVMTCLWTCGRTSWRACLDSPPTPTWGITTPTPSASSNRPKVTLTQFSQVIVDFGAQYAPPRVSQLTFFFLSRNRLLPRPRPLPSL